MAALMVPFGLKSFFGLYPEVRRFLIYRAWPLLLRLPGAPNGGEPSEACANVGAAAVMDSSMATARVFSEIIVVSPLSIASLTRTPGRDEAITLRGPSVLSERGFGLV